MRCEFFILETTPTLGIGDWGLGDWGLGIGDWGLGIGPNPQSPIPIAGLHDGSISIMKIIQY